MSQYLSHLANLALNQLDVVQPRLASRFENHEEAVAPGFMPQDIMNERVDVQENAFVLNKRPATTSRLNESTQNSVSDVVKADIRTPHSESFREVVSSPSPSPMPVEFQPVKIPQPELTQHLVQFDTKTEKIESQIVTQPILPTFKPVNIDPTTTKQAEQVFKEEIVETAQPLLKPIKIARTSEAQIGNEQRQLPSSSLPTQSEYESEYSTEKFDDKPQKHEATLAQELTNARQIVQIQTQQAEPSQPIKPAAIKPESIRIQPLQYEFNSMLTRANQPLPPPVEVASPTINVSIGRIEIRASQTSSPSVAKARPASTTMSLMIT